MGAGVEKGDNCTLSFERKASSTLRPLLRSLSSKWPIGIVEMQSLKVFQWCQIPSIVFNSNLFQVLFFFFFKSNQSAHKAISEAFKVQKSPRQNPHLESPIKACLIPVSAIAIPGGCSVLVRSYCCSTKESRQQHWAWKKILKDKRKRKKEKHHVLFL